MPLVCLTPGDGIMAETPISRHPILMKTSTPRSKSQRRRNRELHIVGWQKGVVQTSVNTGLRKAHKRELEAKVLLRVNRELERG